MSEKGMKRSISWIHGAIITTGAIMGMFSSVGGLVSQVGPPSIIIWPITAIFGLFLCFAYAELATMFPNKSGGISIYGAEAWKDKSRILGTMTVWGYWCGWSPGLAIFALLSGDYVHSMIPSISSYFFGALVIVILFTINYFGILESAISQIVLAIFALIPLVLIAFYPLFTGQVHSVNFMPFLPLNNSWTSSTGILIFLGGMFVASWTSYAAEGAAAYGAEYKNPAKDLPKSILSIGIMMLILCTAVPFALLGVLGQDVISQDPSVAMMPLAVQIFGHIAGTLWIVVLIVMLILNMNGTLLTSSRALYQMSKDGYTFRFMNKLNRHGVPARAMVFDAVINLLLMLLGTPLFIQAASNVGYILVIPIIVAGAIRLRKIAPNMERPYKTRTLTLWIALAVGLFGIVMLAGGVYVWGFRNIILGFIILLFGIPIYLFRKYVEDPAADKRLKNSPNVAEQNVWD